MRVEYDAGVDTAFIYLREVGVDEWKQTYAAVKDMVNLNFDEHQRLVRIEVRMASQHRPHAVFASAK